MYPTANPVLAALARAREQAAPVFVKWCGLNGLSPCPASPADVERFVRECAPLGIERVWPAVQDISKLHGAIGLADPTLGWKVAAAINELARIDAPRSWPVDQKQRFKSLPYDLQLYVSANEDRRDRILRRSQNEAAAARKRLSECIAQHRSKEEGEAHETGTQPTA